MEDCIDRIGNAEYITKCDLLKRYWCVPLTERAKEISAFVTPYGISVQDNAIWHEKFPSHFSKTNKGGHGGRVVTLSPPTSAAGVRSPLWP